MIFDPFTRSPREARMEARDAQDAIARKRREAIYASAKNARELARLMAENPRVGA